MKKRKSKASIEEFDKLRLPKLRTPKVIAYSAEAPIDIVMSVIFLNNIQPSALADETPLFREDDALKIISLAKELQKKLRSRR
jgi:hypothetical protein